jgi:hypothetical protein
MGSRVTSDEVHHRASHCSLDSSAKCRWSVRSAASDGHPHCQPLNPLLSVGHDTQNAPVATSCTTSRLQSGNFGTSERYRPPTRTGTRLPAAVALTPLLAGWREPPLVALVSPVSSSSCGCCCCCCLGRGRKSFAFISRLGRSSDTPVDTGRPEETSRSVVTPQTAAHRVADAQGWRGGRAGLAAGCRRVVAGGKVRATVARGALNTFKGMTWAPSRARRS